MTLQVSTSLCPRLVPSKPKGLVIGDADKARRWDENFAKLFGGELCESVPEALCVLTVQ